jgi:ribonucleotide monophosphatase NagD (HAD superfamily)
MKENCAQDQLRWYLKKWEERLFILVSLIQKFIINQLTTIIKKSYQLETTLIPDIKGANLLNYDSLLISNGVHKNEIKNNGIEKVSKQYESIVNFMQSDLKW